MKIKLSFDRFVGNKTLEDAKSAISMYIRKDPVSVEEELAKKATNNVTFFLPETDLIIWKLEQFMLAIQAYIARERYSYSFIQKENF